MARILLTALAALGFGTGFASAQEKELRAITDKLSESLSQTGKKTVAVVDFTDLQGCVTELGRFVAEELSASLAEGGKGLDVVDRTNLRVTLQENKLAATGVIDPATARKLGQLAGVDSLITGTLTPFGDSVRVAVKVLDAATARIITATRGDIARTKAIDELLSRGVAAGCPASASLEPRPPAQGAPPASEVREFKFTVDSCRLGGSSMTCRLTVLNLAGDRSLKIRAGRSGMGGFSSPSRFIDGSGVEYVADHLQLAGSAGDQEAESTMVGGVPTAMLIRFDEVPSNVTSITLLEVSCEVGRDDGKRGKTSSSSLFKVQFRTITVAR